MLSRAFRAGYAVPPHVLLVPSYARGLVPCGGTAATAISGLPSRLARLTAWFPRPRFVDREGAAGQGRAVEGVYGRLRRAAVRHLDEAKAPRPTGLAVSHDPDRLDAAIGLEELEEVLLRGGKRQVAHKNVHVWFS